MTLQERLDAAVITHRENPTEETKAAVMALMRERSDAFMRSQADEFIGRTRG